MSDASQELGILIRDYSIYLGGIETMTVALALLLLLTPPPAEKPPILIPRAVLLRATERHRLQISPDAKWVGFLTRHRGQSEIWVQSTRHGSKPHRLYADGVSPFQWRWTFGNEVIVSGADSEKPGEVIAVLPLDGTPVRRLAAAHRFDFVRLSPARPREVVVQSTTDDPRTSDLLVLSIDGANETQKIDADPTVLRWFVDRQFRVRAAERTNDRSGHQLARRTKSSWTAIADYGWDIGRWTGNPLAGVVSLSMDGTTLYYVDNQGADTTRLHECNLSTGETKVRLSTPDADLRWAGATLDASSDVPVAVVSFRGELRRHVLDERVRLPFEDLEERVAGDVDFVGQSVTGETWLIRQMNGGPFTYFTFSVEDRKLTRLLSDLPALDAAPKATRHPFEVTARDGLRLPCRLYLPPGVARSAPGVPAQPLPTIISVHGGPWIHSQSNRWAVTRHLQLLANRGYAVVEAEFRGALGFGKRFVDAGDHEWGRDMSNDLIDIADAARDRGIALADKTAIFGWSYGGYAANAAITLAPKRFTCALSLHGLSDLTKVEKPDPLWKQRVGDPNRPEDRARLRAASPIFHVENVERPLLIAHGARDQRIPCSQSDRFVEALVAAKKQVTYLRFAEERHEFGQDRSWHAFWAVGEQFLRQHLGGRCEPLRGTLEGVPLELVAGAEHIEGLRHQKR